MTLPAKELQASLYPQYRSLGDPWEFTGSGGDNDVPDIDTKEGVFAVDDWLEVLIVITADDSSGKGTTVTVTPWRFREELPIDPLDEGAAGGWTKGTPFVVALGYVDVGPKEYIVSTNDSQKLFFQITGIDKDLADGYVSAYGRVERKSAVPVIPAGFAEALTSTFKFGADGKLAVDTELSLAVEHLDITNIRVAATDPSDVTTEALIKLNDDFQVEIDSDALTAIQKTLAPGVGYFVDEDTLDAGSSPLTIDINTDLTRNAQTGYIANDGNGKFTVEISENGTNFGDPFTLFKGEKLALDGLNVDSLILTRISADSDFRVFAK